MISLKQAKKLRLGQVLYHTTNRNSDGSPERWRVNGQVKTWKTRPNEVRIPIKYGLYSCDYLTHRDLYLVSTTEKQAIRHGKAMR